MLDELSKMPAWRFVLVLVFTLLVLAMFFTLVSEGSLSEETITNIIYLIVGLLGGGVGGTAFGARMRTGARPRWDGKERRRP